jgi:hypothetical protein
MTDAFPNSPAARRITNASKADYDNPMLRLRGEAVYRGASSTMGTESKAVRIPALQMPVLRRHGESIFGGAGPGGIERAGSGRLGCFPR